MAYKGEMPNRGFIASVVQSLVTGNQTAPAFDRFDAGALFDLADDLETIAVALKMLGEKIETNEGGH